MELEGSVEVFPCADLLTADDPTLADDEVSPAGIQRDDFAFVASKAADLPDLVPVQN